MDPIMNKGLKVAYKLRNYIKEGNFSRFIAWWKDVIGSEPRSSVDGFLEVMAAAKIEPFRTLVLDTNGVSDSMQNQVRNILSIYAKNSAVVHVSKIQNQNWLLALKHLGFEVYQSDKHVCVVVPDEELEAILFDLAILMDDDVNVASFRKL